MTEHAAAATTSEHAPAHGHDDHGHGAHDGHDNSPGAVKKEIRRYLMVLGALAILTLVTVGISYLKLPTGQAIALGLAVAIVKGSLVAAFFMHLISERKLIYAVLVFTVFFFGMLMWGPWHHHYDAEREWPGHDVTNQHGGTTPPAAAHGSTH